ncbi:hypothetical protein [Nocardia asiatica]|uniref:hypothetical protein n=1 Tax=Nocardia asiatica TaxID=209252 RepID=UPI003EE1BA01
MMVSGDGGSPPSVPPSGPATDLSDDKKQPGPELVPGQWNDVANDSADDGSGDNQNEPIDLGQTSDPGQTTDPAHSAAPDGNGTLPWEGAPPGAQDIPPTAQDTGSTGGLDPDATGDNLGNNAENATDLAGFADRAAGPGDAAGVAPYLAGPNAAQPVGEQSHTRPLSGRLVGAGSGGSGHRAEADPVKRAAAARPVPRAGIAPEEPVRAGARAGLPGAPGAPGPVAGRRRDGEEDQEHKPAGYLESDEHLNEAIGQLPPVYRPVVDR